uniref:Kinetochore protein Spc24 n=1 Tax=Tetradesmus obliquus TaxID=3088 RepID=A0A383WLM5_TETOB|eukprot:jgi/Sobl393_1/1058/SZX77646.1
MAAAYPAEPFKQADSLLTGMIESYRGSTDAADMADIQSLLETTVKIARDREYRVHNNIKELSQKVAGLEAAAVYSDAKASHEQRMTAINSSIAEVQQEQQQLQQRQKQLLANKEQLVEQQQVVEPDKLNRITLYANITGVAFEYSSLGEQLLQATVSDSVRGEVRPVSIDRSQPTFEQVNALWNEIPCPALE